MLNDSQSSHFWSNDLLYSKRAVWIVFILSLLFTAGVSYRFHMEHEKVMLTHFNDAVTEANKLIETRILMHQGILKDTIGLYESSEYLSQGEWNHFIQSQDIDTDYPGLKEIGISFTNGNKSLIYTLFTPYTSSAASITGNMIDTLSADPLQSSAIQECKENGFVTLSQKFTLPNRPVTFLRMYMPLYDQNKPHTTLDERKEAFVGVTYATLEISKIFNPIVGDATRQLHFTLYDTSHPQSDHLLYRSPLSSPDHDPKHLVTSLLNVGGKSWSAVYASTPAFETKIHLDISPIIGTIGVLLNLLLLTLHLIFIKNRKKLIDQYGELHMLHQLIDESNDMIFIIRIDNSAIEYTNKTAEKLLGYSREEIRAIGIEGFRHPIKENEPFLEHLQELKKMGRLMDYAIVTRKDGSEFMIEANVRAIKYNGIDYNLAIVRDISENETYNQKIAKTSSILKEAQRLAKLGNWQLNLITNNLEWSDEIYTIFEIDPKKNTPSYESFLNAIHPEDRELVNEAYTHSVGNRTFYDYTHRLLISDGRIKYVREQGETFYDANGTPIESRGTVHDITEQKELENTLRQKNIDLTNTTDRLQLATQASKIGIWVWNFCDNSLTWDNKMFELYTEEKQHGIEVLPYDTWKDCVHPDDVQYAEQDLINTLHFNKPFNSTFRIITPNGGIKYIYATAIVKYDEYHNPLYMVGTNRDITVEKILQDTLIVAKEAAENANKAKSAFLANMSHEIRTPLNGVIGLIDLVLQSNLSPVQNDYLTKAEMAAKALLSVLNTILDYSKIEASKLTLERIPFDVHEILENIHALFSYKAEEKNIDLHFDTDSTIPQRLLGDPLRFQQILSNLVGNAMKFTDEGEVRVSITAQTEEAKCKLTVKITDTGIGLTEEQQQNLFSPFYQADSSFTRKYGGSGLGLMITKELIELMGGTISVSSTPNGGSTFTFTARFDPYEFSPQEFETIALKNQYNILATTKDIHILLVEDNDLNVLVASERLKQMGFRISVANNGLEAVEMVRDNDYDAVLMDLQMPVMDGFTATKEIRKIPGKEKLPIIALSAAVMKEDQMLSTQSGMNAHIAKPIDKVVLRDILAKWIKF